MGSLTRPVVAFTGHRDRAVDPAYLDGLVKQFPKAIWVHGGAQGFDQQVQEYADEHNVAQVIIPPDYVRYGPKVAPIKRNEVIVDLVHAAGGFLVTCWDGRKHGGTYRTREYARSLGMDVKDWRPL